MSSGYAMAEASEETVYVTRPKKAVKKPGFIARWLWAGLKTASDAERSERGESIAEQISMKERAAISKASIDRGSDLNTEPMRFSVYHANGGFVVETRTPTRNSVRNTIGDDRPATKLHIIHKDADLGQELAKIITMEGLRA